jgi:hypothetical protein
MGHSVVFIYRMEILVSSNNTLFRSIIHKDIMILEPKFTRAK